jgi:hypothetical protein
MEVIGRAVLSGSESDRQITAALMTLSQEWRRVVYYADVEGFPRKEIAERMNTPVPIAVSRLHRGRRRLRAALFMVAIQRGFAFDHTRDHALCLMGVAMNGAAMTPDSVARWWVSLQRGLSHHRSSPRRRLALLRRTDTFAGSPGGKTMTGRPPARPQVSHFETLIDLMLRRSPSARGGVMSGSSQCNDTED